MDDNFDEKIIKAAHKHSFLNKEEILKSEVCGCFDCLRLFEPSEIKEWQHDIKTSTEKTGYTAICPFGCFDTVIGSASGYPITVEFLKVMQKYWCPTQEQIDAGEVEVIEASSFDKFL